MTRKQQENEINENHASERLHKRIMISVRAPTSKNSKKTLSYAIQLAKLTGADVYIIHVEPKEIQVDEKEIKEKIISFVTEIKNKVKYEGNIKVRIMRGETVDCIRAADRELKPDLLILGSHKRSFLEDVIGGLLNLDITEEITRNVSCSVLIVR
ncbi:MAG: universal stress protein [Candidatus Aenigmarchaeota archaeon]|nr:universal stress protein [Candidatus Aenigmarchaeota archaeon]